MIIEILFTFITTYDRKTSYGCRVKNVYKLINVRIAAPTNQPTNQSTKELPESGDLRESASRRPSVSLAIPALTASLGSVTNTLTITWIALTTTISRRCWRPRRWQTGDHFHEAIVLLKVHNFSWKAFLGFEPRI